MVETGEMSSLKRKIDVMKSPTSLIRFRNAVGVMLALSAIFAVVLSTISLTSDKATAQVADEDTDAIAERAEAWWNSLDNVQMVNALRGYEADNDAGEAGRQLGDPTRTNIEQGTQYDEDGNVVTTGGTDGVPYTSIEQAQRMFDELEQADKDSVIALVNGNTNDGDIYAVGEHFTDVGRALRGFQSVPQWWAYVDCAEARRSVGEDNNAISTNPFNDPHTADVTETTTEPSAVCEVVGEAGSEVVQVKAYSSLGDAQALVDKVGQALLGLDAPGSPMTADNARAEAWWNLLSAPEMVRSLYGDNANVSVPDVDDPNTMEVDESKDTRPERAQAMYDGLDSHTKALVNDRWLWIYNNAGRDTPNTMGTDDVIHWWNTIDCASMRVVVGVDNEPIVGQLPNAPAYCAMWDGLGAEEQETVFPLGRAILGLPAQPSAQRWWDALTEAQRVNVVYGNPPERSEDWDHDGDEADTSVNEADRTPRIPFVTDADKAVFTTMYDGLDGSVPSAGHLTTEFVALLTRQGVTQKSVEIDDGQGGTPTEQRYLAKDIVHALADELFDPPAANAPDNLVDRHCDHHR